MLPGHHKFAGKKRFLEQVDSPSTPTAPPPPAAPPPPPPTPPPPPPPPPLLLSGGGSGGSNALPSPTSGGAGEPAVKRQAVEGPTPPVLQSVAAAAAATAKGGADNVLLQQNRQLRLKNEELKRDVDALQAEVKTAQQRHATYESILQLVHRHWTNLERNFRFLLMRVDPAKGRETLVNASSMDVDAQPKAHSLHAFVERLAQRELPGPELDSSLLRPIDVALTERKQSSGELLTKLADAITLQKQRNDELATQLASASTDEVLRTEDRKLRSDLDATQLLLDELQLKLHDSVNDCGHSRDQLLKALCESERLKVEAEKARDEAEVLRRQLDKLRMEKQELEASMPAGGAGAAASGASAVTPTPTTPSAPSEHLEVYRQVANRLSDELQQAKELAESRLREYDVMLAENKALKCALAEKDVKSFRQSSSRGDADNHEQMLKQRDQDLVELGNMVATLRMENLTLEDRFGKESATTQEQLRIMRTEFATQVSDRERTVAQLRNELDQMRMSLQVAQQQAKNTSTVELTNRIKELSQLAQSQHEELERLRDERKSTKEKVRQLQATIDDSKSDDGSRREELERTHRECEELRAQMRRSQTELADVRRQNKTLTEKVQDLQLSIEVYQSSSRDKRELHEIRLAERTLAKEVSELKAELERLTGSSSTADGNAVSGSSEAAVIDDRIRLVAQVAALETRVAELEADLSGARAECDALMTEMEAVGKAFEETQEQNGRLLKQLNEHDDRHAQLMAESVRARQVQTLLREEKEAAASRLAAAEELRVAQQQQLEAAEMRFQHTQLLMERAYEELRTCETWFDSQKRATAEAQEASTQLRMELENAQKAVERITELHAEQANEVVAERRRVMLLTEELELLKKKLERFQQSKSAQPEVEELEARLADTRRKLLCSVCQEREKNTVITRCFHAFCRECIQRNLQVRNRKCPTCAEKFGDKDTHDLYM